MSIHFEDLELLDAIKDFVLEHGDTNVGRFKAAMRDWGDDWLAVEKSWLPAADLLTQALAYTDRDLRQTVALFDRHKHDLHWEQSYRKQDGVVSDALLAGSGFAEITGSRGPFVSERIRSGIGVWGPDIVYPRHRHQAEEVYILLAGSAEFKVGDGDARIHTTGEVVYVPSNMPHEFRTAEQMLVVLYLWQAGDLRQISHFG